MFGPLFSPLLGDYTDTLWFPEQASAFAEDVDSVFMFILWISLIFFVGIVFAMVWFMVKYSKAKGGKATSRARHNNVLEISWSVLPSFLLVVMFVRGSWGYLDERSIPTGAAEVNVGAYRWGWNFDYGSGVNQPELHVVKDEPTSLIMQSSDVIHSLFIPAFRVKRDVVPGRYNRMWFTATKASERVSDEELAAAKEIADKEYNGVFDPEVFGFTRHGYKFYDLYCTEYCGKDHSMMQSVVVVHEDRADFEAWLEDADRKPEGMSDEAYGRILYEQQGCKSCHSLDGSKVVGPSFLGIYERNERMESGEDITVDENYLRESILEPMAKIVDGYPKAMPSYKGRLSEEKLQALIAFLKSVK